MKWLLITNFGNPGDEVARRGVEVLIRSVDSSATFETVRRDQPSFCTEKPIQESREFDVAVVCSMPGFWSHKSEDGQTLCTPVSHHSWKEYNSWLSEKPLIMAGFGFYLADEDNILDRANLISEFRQFLKTRTRAFYSRSSAASRILGMDVPSHPCPSIFAGAHLTPKPEFNLCNMSLNGTHYPWLAPREVESWHERAPKLAKFLQSMDYKFAAHSPEEKDFAIINGWCEDDIFTFDGDVDKFLDVYSHAGCYIGNRIHGAIVARSFGAKVLCIGQDTRLIEVQDVGGEITTPTTFSPSLFRGWLKDTAFEFDRERFFGAQQAIFQRI